MTKPTSIGAAASSLLEPFSVFKSRYLCMSLHRSPNLAISSGMIMVLPTVLDIAAFFLLSPLLLHWMLQFLLLFYESSKLPWENLLLSGLQGIHTHLEIPDAKSSTSSPNSCNFFTRGRGAFTTLPGISFCVPCPCFCLSLVPPPSTHGSKTVWQLYQKGCNKEEK